MTELNRVPGVTLWTSAPSRMIRSGALPAARQSWTALAWVVGAFGVVACGAAVRMGL